MKSIDIPGVFQDRNKLFTQNLKECKNLKIYNERIIRYKGNELRSWNPYRSKLAAAMLNGLSYQIKSDSSVLYLGAATGTTVSHISDITSQGIIYAVENSPVAMKKLLEVCKTRKNIIPILSDANHPERYGHIVSNVDFIYQDISQRNQAEIFLENIERFLSENGTGILMVKARSIDVSLKPNEAYKRVCLELEKSKLKIHEIVDLKPYEKDHAAILISY